MRICLKIEYDGTDFCGWQIQPNKRTVQQTVADAIKTLTGEEVNLVGSGRTDSGVHARGQIAHFETEATIPAERFALALNTILPSDVKIVESFEVEESFHARFSAKRKTYEYKMYISESPRPLKERYSTRIGFPLDIEKMKKACEYFVGRHDFRCFLASGSAVKDTVREIYRAEIFERDGDIVFEVCGNGFLYNMVRIMVGTLVKVGMGKLEASEVEKIIKLGERKGAGITLPPQGLTLVSVEY